MNQYFIHFICLFEQPFIHFVDIKWRCCTVFLYFILYVWWIFQEDEKKKSCIWDFRLKYVNIDVYIFENINWNSFELSIEYWCWIEERKWKMNKLKWKFYKRLKWCMIFLRHNCWILISALIKNNGNETTIIIYIFFFYKFSII